MSGVGLLRRSPAGSRREHRRREELQLRLRGQYGPQWWEVLPAFAVVVTTLALPLAFALWLWSRFGWWASVLGLAAFGYGITTAVARRRRTVRARQRSRTTFSLAEVDAADARGYRRIVGRLLQRDGWQRVRGVRVNDVGAVHLVGEWPGSGQRLGVAFERGIAETDGDGPRGVAALRPVMSPAPEETAAGRPTPLLLVVSSGTFDRRRVLWAARTGVWLVDRALLARWAAGENLATLLGLDLGN